MKDVFVSLAKASDVKEFVAVTQDYPFPIYLKSGKYVVDAKSILGIFSLDLCKPVTLSYDEDATTRSFEGKIKKFEVKN